ncbi:threonine--tRNA ligase [Nocardioides sp. NPDC057772]|uniref:threonine--tRNA ligase n=1 Tax=Nocardioides sp. NPDC057772 TaxID=3346245 RepID=UPI00366AA66B
MNLDPADRLGLRFDHRDLNRDLDIFATDPLAGSGLPLWLPDGAVVFAELERLAAELAAADGCVPVKTPVLGKRALFERSGHWAKFADDMFPPMAVGSGSAGEEDDLVLRPANCPHHALVYRARPHSYRQLPVRLHELAPMFRAERSGVLSGLSRVRQINLDDTHVFCRPDQVAEEAAKALRSALRAQEILGLRVDYVRLSLRDSSPSYLGSAEQWRGAEEALRKAASEAGVEVVEAPGEAAFYGPKLDLQVNDPRGQSESSRAPLRQEETIATVQVDFNQPERFDLSYDDADGTRKRVVMVHRGTVGSMERVTAAVLERYQGRLPLWLAPTQVAILPVSPGQDAAARVLVDALVAEGLRPRLDPDGSLGARIRESRRRREPLIAVIGSAEAEAGEVQVRDVGAGVERRVPVADLVAAMKEAYVSRAVSLGW